MTGCVLLGAALPSRAPAGTNTWTNLNGGLWSQATNWSPHQVPTSSDFVLITNLGSYRVMLDGNVALSALSQGTAIITNVGGAHTITNVSGGYIAVTNATNQANLFFGTVAGTRTEGLIYVAQGATLTLAGTNDAAAITKFGAGTLSLLANNPCYSNGWNINQGQLNASFSNALGMATAGNFVNLNGGVTLLFNQNAAGASNTSGKITSTDFNSITFNIGAVDRTVFAAPLGIDINSVSNGSLGAGLRLDLDQSRSRAVITGPVTVNAATATLNARNTGSALNTTGGSNRVDFAGGLAGAGKSISKIGNGILGLPTDNRSNWLGGNIDVLGGSLAVGHNGSLGNPASAARIRSGAVLELNSTLQNFVSAATVTQDSGSAERWKGTLNRFTGAATTDTITMGAGVNLQLVADLTGLANKTVSLNGGSIEAYRFVDSPGAISNTVTVDTGITLNLIADSKVGMSGVDLGRTTNVTLMVNGQITGPGSLTKTGVDFVTLTASNTYSGGTIAEQGTLFVNNTVGSGTGTGDVTVNYNGSLGGSGTIAGAVTVNLGGRLFPYYSVSTLTVAGLTMNAGSTFLAGIDSTSSYSRLVVRGTVNLNGTTLALNFGTNTTFPAGQVFTLIKNEGGNPVSGAFAGLPEGLTFSNLGTNVFIISYAGGAGNDVELYTAPAPPSRPRLTATPSEDGALITFTNYAGAIGFTYAIEASTNLADWLPVTFMFINSTDTVQFTDSDATNFPYRFYRASLVP